MFDEDTSQKAVIPVAPDPTRSPNLELDTVFELLANRSRRYGLYALLDASEQAMSFQTLLENVVTFEAAMDGTGVTRDRYLETGADLYEWHLPVLVDVGLVDVDGRHDTVRYLGDPLLNFWLREVRRYELRG